MDILVDCDGVLADIVSAIKKELPWHGFPEIADEDRKNLGTSVVGKDLPPELRRVVREQILREPGFVCDIPAYPGARAFLDELRKRGHNVYCVTSPFYESETWMPERVAWLEDVMGFDPKQVLFVPSEQKWRVRGDWLIEDREDIADAFNIQQAIGKAIVIERPWNVGKPCNYWTARFACRTYAKALSKIIGVE